MEKPVQGPQAGGASHDDQVRQQFTVQAASFGQQGLTLSSAEYLDWVVGQLTLAPGSRVLDVAAGTGHLGRALAGRVGSVVAVDLTPAMIAEGRREAARGGITNLRYAQGRAERLPLAGNSCDMVVTRLSLHHFLDPRPAVNEIARVCRRGGQVAVMDMVSPDDAALAEPYNHFERLRDPSHTRCLTLGELQGMLRGSGLTITQVAGREITVKPGPWMEMTATPEPVRATIRAALQGELAGGPVTGMRPYLRGSDLLFTQTWVTVVARR